MKKILVSALAAMTLVACMQEEIVTLTQSDAISFQGAYVENATRAAVDPSTTTASIDGFDVWAFMNESNGTVLNDEDVKKVVVLGLMLTHSTGLRSTSIILQRLRL